MGKNGGTLILCVGLARRTSAELSLWKDAFNWVCERAMAGPGTICAEGEIAFWTAEVHGRQLALDGRAWPGARVGKGEVLEAVPQWH